MAQLCSSWGPGSRTPSQTVWLRMSPAIRARGQGPTPSLHARLKESLHNDTLCLPDKAGRFQDRPVQKKQQPHTFDPAFGVEVLFSFRSLQREKRQSAPGANYLATTWPHTQKLFDYLAPPFRGLGAQRSVLKNVVSEGARSRSPLFNPGGGSRSNNEPLLHLRMKLVQQR